MRSILAFIGSLALSAGAFAQGQAPVGGVPASTGPVPSTIPAAGGNIYITPIKHASFQIEYANRFIQVDPISTNNNAQAVQADVILVTDIHGDHMDAKAIDMFRKPEGIVIVPASVRDALGAKLPNPTVMANGESKTLYGIGIEAVPMYNLQRGPSAGQLYHPKGRGNGYLLTLGGKRLYIAGDTECTPEMKALKNIDVAFIPMNLPYTMTPVEAADCTKVFAPKVVYPYHYTEAANEQAFADALKGTPNVQVRTVDWYAVPAPPRGQGGGGRGRAQ
jgi:L-ascorbate metabolism protein UlaG (beta-lactamase superfamily)